MDSFPTHLPKNAELPIPDLLGPDPEPLGIRAEVLLGWPASPRRESARSRRPSTHGRESRLGRRRPVSRLADVGHDN